MDINQVSLVTKMVLDVLAKKEDSVGFMVPVGVSARHVHLTAEHVEVLFGKGHELSKKKDLMGGQFAANEQVTIVGIKLRAIENVRVLGPVRARSQVEISMTDALKLGIKASVRQSGDIRDSSPISIVGPRGAIYIREGCIVAARHIHMTPTEALSFGVADGDMVSVAFDSQRGAVMDNVKIRVDDAFTLEMHIDTDEANAVQIGSGTKARLLK